jgi:mycothiol synthase
MLWPSTRQVVPEPDVPSRYQLRIYRPGEDQQVIDLLSSDGEVMSKSEWQQYRDMLLPNGLFLIEESATRSLVASAGAVHNPNAGRYYFPSGGELGYLIVAQAHRRQGLGEAVCRATVHRMLSAGYESIRVCVQEHRAPAIRTYLQLGFEPFVHSGEVEQRWRRVCDQLQTPFDPEWPRSLV